MRTRGRTRPPTTRMGLGPASRARFTGADIAASFDKGIEVGLILAEKVDDPLGWSEVADIFREDDR